VLRQWSSFWLVVVAVCAFASPGAAQTADVPVPEPLEPWVDWVTYEHPDLGCPQLGEGRACVWPGRLQLDVDETEATFRMDVWLARRTTVELPGSSDYWPQSVEVDAETFVVTESDDGGPAIVLLAGDHRVTGSFRWTSPPEMLPIPEASGRVRLTIDDRAIDRPRIDDQHRLWLRDATSDIGREDDANTVRVSVYRRLEDGVPMEVTTRIQLNVSGRARKIGLGELLPTSTRPTGVSSSLPVQIDGRSLQAYVRPGTHEVTVDAVLPQSTSTLRVPDPEPDIYDPREVWIWVPDDEIRSVELEGLSTVDPSRTSLPDD
jgi:hypothetical protein